MLVSTHYDMSILDYISPILNGGAEYDFPVKIMDCFLAIEVTLLVFGDIVSTRYIYMTFQQIRYPI